MFQRNCRQSCRTTGAILSPPRPLSKHDWKEWPAAGLHERPFYNPLTNTLEKFDIGNVNTSINADIISDEIKNSKDLLTNIRKKKSSANSIERFAILTHESLHLALEYVADVKEYNKIKKNIKVEIHLTSANEKEDFFQKDLKLASDCLETNLRQACDVLLDVSKLYCCANRVQHKDLAKYISTISTEHL